MRLISLGDYVLNGGEVAVMAMVEAIGRLIPGVVGNPESLVEESHEDGLLEYPSYTKPSVWRDREVPPILLSGNHGAIAAWRREQQLERTRRRRPDLLRGRRGADRRRSEQPFGVAGRVRTPRRAGVAEQVHPHGRTAQHRRAQQPPDHLVRDDQRRAIDRPRSSSSSALMARGRADA